MIKVFWMKFGLGEDSHEWAAYLTMPDGDTHLLFAEIDETKFFERYNAIKFTKKTKETMR